MIRKNAIRAAGAGVAAAIAAFLAWQLRERPAATPAAAIPPTATVAVNPTAAVGARPLPAPAFAGYGACLDCHADAAAAWRGSQHAVAMQPATPATVLGDFGAVRFTYAGVTTTFFRKGETYVVRTDGPDGALADFPITYTFGVYPLQQYLIDFPDGRKQALAIAWDARPAGEGGQRWFHLYPDERIDHRDPLHWTRREQNWNFVCADCHSTGLRRNYDVAADRYATTWSDLPVACEACHGPGSNHVAWARRAPGSEGWKDRGLAIPLDERRDVRWTAVAAGTPLRSRALGSRREVETCAVCHARRRPIGTDSGPTGRLLDTHVPSLLEAPLYEADGQQHDEVYTYGSFLQSKMYAQGVTCADCHEPHAGTLRAAGNSVCATCHAADGYDTPAHHRHAAGGAGAQCVACHMPARTYMVVDPRHDHSFRVPRPDLSERDGVPNGCNGCHADRDAAWAAARVVEWYGPTRKGLQTFGAALRAGREGAPGAVAGLVAVVTNTTVPDVARATAAAGLESFPGPGMMPGLQTALADASALVRQAGLDALRSLPPPMRVSLAAPLAGDPVKAVRVKAGRALAAGNLDRLPPEAAGAAQRAINEYVASERAVAERPEAHLNLGLVDAERGEANAAEAEYRAALRLDPTFAPAWVNLADLERQRGRGANVASVLAEGLAVLPDEPSLLHALGLQRVRERRPADALPLLERAAVGRPEDVRFAYVYGVALHSAGRVDEALAVLAAALARAPYDSLLLAGLATFERDAGRREAALGYARRLVAVLPDDPGAQQLVEELGGG